MDANQADIVNALVAHGCSVQSMACLGAGCPDLLVGIHGANNVLLEVKNQETARGQKAETIEAQAKWKRNWKGKPPIKVETVEEALRAVGLL